LTDHDRYPRAERFLNVFMVLAATAALGGLAAHKWFSSSEPHCEPLPELEKVTLSPPARIRSQPHAKHSTAITTIQHKVSIDLGSSNHTIPACYSQNGDLEWRGIRVKNIPAELEDAFGSGADERMPTDKNAIVWFAVSNAVIVEKLD